MVLSVLHKRLHLAICSFCGTALARRSVLTLPSLALDPTSAMVPQDTDRYHHGKSGSPGDPITPSGISSLMSVLSASLAPARPKLKHPALIVVQSKREVRLPGISLVYLGRRDEKQNIYPHIDLTGDGGARYGVSRRHARIHQSDDGIFIEDVGSTNGTYINSQPLIPFKLYPLELGDILQLGQLKASVTLARER
jgi:hypothetical protein